MSKEELWFSRLSRLIIIAFFPYVSIHRTNTNSATMLRWNTLDPLTTTHRLLPQSRHQWIASLSTSSDIEIAVEVHLKQLLDKSNPRSADGQDLKKTLSSWLISKMQSVDRWLRKRLRYAPNYWQIERERCKFSNDQKKLWKCLLFMWFM